jgi:hypothetical protein
MSINEQKDEVVVFRITSQKKRDWKKICLKRKISLTSLIISSVEDRLMIDERRDILTFIEKQDNVFRKIENNINQVAKITNGQKYISEKQLRHFSLQLNEIADLKKQQNVIFLKIYSLIANDR